ncbi:hypothetical protein FPV60_02440 [Acinetobacter colistiniresistens]|uniref:Uncharacterized protein n=1 Tax=Acinetobacter colistiniresistens TaxID=280145 RepID=A0A558FN13_9GAMM|nr:hypothetical protein FPV60_02440 [Acinetobacter colistiniresistens]
MVIRGPIGCTIDFRCRLLHLEIILLKKPSRIALCNKAIDNYEDESISYEDLPKALDLTIEYSYKYSGLEELWCSIKKIILTAIENKTAVFFFF